MRRRVVLGLAVALVLPLELRAQQAAKVRRIGILRTSRNFPQRYAALMEGLRERGWVEGRNLAIEWRDIDGRSELAQPRAEELVKAGVELIVVNATTPTRSVRRATATLPIVGVFGDPVSSGLAQSLARPGGNVTGVSVVFDGMIAKLFELTLETLPRISRLAFLNNPDGGFAQAQAKEMKALAAGSNVALLDLWARTPAEIDVAFSTLTRERSAALIVSVEPFLVTERARIADLALRARLPAFANSGEFVDAGFLASYGSDFNLAFRNMARYVDAILKGAKPGDLPIEQMTRLELALNLKSARELGVKIPQVVRLRADRIIE